jgi:hypothetical protein
MEAGRKNSLLVGVNRALLLLVFFLSSLQAAGWKEELLIGWRKQRLIPIGALPATPVGFGLAGRAPPI